MENGDAELSEFDSSLGVCIHNRIYCDNIERETIRWPVSVPGDGVVSPCVAGVFLLDAWIFCYALCFACCAQPPFSLADRLDWREKLKSL